MLTTPAIILLLINLGLLWLLMAAPMGVLTIRLKRKFPSAPETLREAVHPLGRNATWYPSVITSEPAGEENRVRQTFSHTDRNGQPIERTLEIAPMQGDWTMAYEAHVVEDSALDPAFWKDFSERRLLRPTLQGTELIVEQTDRYRGLAFFLFRFFQLRRELKALDGWLITGSASSAGLIERPATQVVMAAISTLVLWPFFGFSAEGLVISAMLTVVIAFHEIGHLAAYRAFGHQSVKMIFIPFLGGVAIGGRPYRSQFEVATCALMGAGLSAFCVPMLIGFHTIVEQAGGQPGATHAGLVMLLILGAFNLLNLLPMTRFDGGQVLRQIFTSRNGLLLASFFVTGAIAWTGWRIGIPEPALYGALAVMALLSLFNQLGAKPRNALQPIEPGERIMAMFGYYAAITLHAYAVIYASDRLF